MEPCLNRRKRLRYLALTLAFPTLLQAQPATLNGETLLVPDLAVGDQRYSAEFTLIADLVPPTFVLTSANELVATGPNEISSIYKNGTLSIPEVSFADQFYWVELSLSSSEPIQFRLAGYGK